MAGDPYSNMDPDFAGRLRQLVAGSGGRLSITDGFRSRAQQADLYARKPHLAAPPGHSLHERGLAADLAGDLDYAHAHAGDYGLNFPMLSGRKIEPWHIQLGGGGMPRTRAAVQTQTANVPAQGGDGLAGYTGLNPQLSALAPVIQQATTPLPPIGANPNDIRPTQTIQWPLLPNISSTVSGATPREAAQQSALDVAATAPDPNAIALAQHQGAKDYLDSLSVLRSQYAPQSMGAYTSPPAPIRKEIPFPDQEELPDTTTPDIVSGILGALFPRMAGRLAGGVTNAALAERQRQQDIAEKVFAQEQGRANQEYGDAEQQRQDAIRFALMNRAQDAADKERAREYGLETGNLGLKGTEEQTLLDALTKNSTDTRKYQLSALAQGQKESDIARQDALQNAAITARNEANKEKIGLLGKMVPSVVNNIGRESVANTNLEGRKYVADKGLTGREYAADAGYDARTYAADQGLAGRKYVADQGLAGRKYAADQATARKTAANPGLVKSDPTYAALWRDYNLKAKAIETAQRALSNSLLDDNVKASIATTLQMNADEQQQILHLMNEKEQAAAKANATTNAKPTLPPLPAKPGATLNGQSAKGYKYTVTVH